MRLRCVPVALLVTLFLAGPTKANPIYPDEQSLQRGADAYSRHCAECHGWSLVDTYRERDEEGVDDEYGSGIDYDALVGEVTGVELQDDPEIVYVEEDEEEAWPEWAEYPDPEEEDRARRERAQALREITEAIDFVYGAELDAQDVEDAADELADVDAIDLNGPVGSATDLQYPDRFYFGKDEQAIFNSIAQGNGADMPAFGDSLDSEEVIWDLVNFIRSFWPEEARF